MDVAALVLWLVTATGGITLAAFWLANRGPAQHRAGESRISTVRLGAHAALAAGGLLLWIAHVVSDSTAVGWVAFALLPLTAAAGFVLFVTWLAGRGAVQGASRPAEQHFPVLVVAAHGLLAVFTLVVVLVAAAT